MSINYPGPRELVTLTVADVLAADGDPLVSWQVGTGQLWSSLATALDYCEDYGDVITMWRGAEAPRAADLMDDLLEAVAEWSADYGKRWGWAAILDVGGEPDGCVLEDREGDFASAIYKACEVALEDFDPETSPRTETEGRITFTPELERAVAAAR